MDAAVDTSPLIFLAQLGRLELTTILGEVVVPEQVILEIEEGERRDPDSVAAVRECVRRGILSVRKVDVPPDFFPRLGTGERAALRLATGLPGRAILADEKKARSAAKALGIQFTSTPFLLARAVEVHRIDKEAFRREMDRLVRLRYFISPHLYRDLLELVDRT